MSLPASVIACECWARDGLQSMPLVVSTDAKIEMINRIVAAGFPKLEVTSFSHPKLLPQFADAVEVLQGIDRRADVVLRRADAEHEGVRPLRDVRQGGLRRRRDHPDDLGQREAQPPELPRQPRGGDGRTRRDHEARPRPGRADYRLRGNGLRLPGQGRHHHGRGREDRRGSISTRARRRSCSATPRASRTRSSCASASAS